MLGWIQQLFGKKYIDLRIFDDVGGQYECVKRYKYVSFYEGKNKLRKSFQPYKGEMYQIDHSLAYKERGKAFLNYVKGIALPIPLVAANFESIVKAKAGEWALIHDDKMMKYSLTPPSKMEMWPIYLIVVAIACIPISIFLIMNPSLISGVAATTTSAGTVTIPP